MILFTVGLVSCYCVCACVHVYIHEHTDINIDCVLVVNKIFLSRSLLLYFLKLEDNAHLPTAYAYGKAIY